MKAGFEYDHEVRRWFLLLCSHVIRDKSEVSVRGDERENSLRLPSLEADTRVKAHIVQESGVLQGKKTHTTGYPTSLADKPQEIIHKQGWTNEICYLIHRSSSVLVSSIYWLPGNLIQ